MKNDGFDKKGFVGQVVEHRKYLQMHLTYWDMGNFAIWLL